MSLRLLRAEENGPSSPPVRVLLVAEHVLIAALLGALVELAGHQPCYADANESAADAIHRLAPAVVLLDGRHDASGGDEVYWRASQYGASLFVFGHRSDRLRITALAARHGARSLEIPMDYAAFTRALSEPAASDDKEGAGES